MHKEKYHSLYGKYRPQDFSEVVGQRHVISVLEAIVGKEQVFHAYLFSGSHGTGKTSVARIFACALNVGNNPTEIKKCAANISGTFDIIEMDAASNSGVEEIRHLLKNIGNLPLKYPFKIYIIDEVHMLSKNAFNALLKSVEEPPDYVIFILATTEIAKVPLTLLSRVQRHNFVPLYSHEIVGRLKEVALLEQHAFEEEALELISRWSKGSLRDALTLLEQLISFSGSKPLSAEGVREILGLLSTQNIISFFNAFGRKDSPKVVESLNICVEEASSSETFFNSLLLSIRDYLSWQISPEGAKARLEILTPKDITTITMAEDEAFVLMDFVLETLRGGGDLMIAQRILELRVLDYISNPIERPKVVVARKHKTNQEVIEIDEFDHRPINRPPQEEQKTSQPQENFEEAPLQKSESLGEESFTFEAPKPEPKTLEGPKKIDPRRAEIDDSTYTFSGFGHPKARKKEEPELTEEEILAIKERFINFRESLKVPTKLAVPARPREENTSLVDPKTQEVFGQGRVESFGEENSPSALDLAKVAFHSSEVQNTLKKWQELEEDSDKDTPALEFEDFTTRDRVERIEASLSEPDSSPTIDQEETLNLLMQINIDDKKFLEEYKARMQLIPPHFEKINRAYYSLLKDLVVLRASRLFLIVSSKNKLALEQLNKARLKTSFIHFVVLIFKRALYFFGVSEEELKKAEEELTKLKRQNTTFRAKPLKPLTFKAPSKPKLPN